LNERFTTTYTFQTKKEIDGKPIIINIFVMSSITGAKGSPARVPGFFVAQKYSGVVPPREGYNDFHSPGEGLDNGKGDTVFLLPVLNLIEMSKKLPGATAPMSDSMAQYVAILARQNHKNSRASLIFDLHTRSTDKLISDFLIEMDAKSRAYFFILENGHWESFKAYCQEENEVCSEEGEGLK